MSEYLSILEISYKICKLTFLELRFLRFELHVLVNGRRPIVDHFGDGSDAFPVLDLHLHIPLIGQMPIEHNNSSIHVGLK
jgi:hypothetical protein